MKYYVAGPMTDYPELNFPAFHKQALHLRECGHEVINPAEVNPDVNADWLECMFVDMELVKGCDAIYMLEGWENSPGAQIEHLVAKKYKLKIEYE